MYAQIIEQPNGNSIIDYWDITFIVLVRFSSFDNSISLLVVTAQIPLDIKTSCGNTVFVNASTLQLLLIPFKQLEHTQPVITCRVNHSH